jgi:hypothetical protein
MGVVVYLAEIEGTAIGPDGVRIKGVSHFTVCLDVLDQEVVLFLF